MTSSLLRQALRRAATIAGSTLLVWASTAQALTQREYVEQVVSAGLPARVVEAEAALERAEQTGLGQWSNPELHWQRETAGGDQDFFLLAVPLVLSGRLGLERDAAALGREAAEARLRHARAGLRRDAQAAFANVLAARERHAALESAVKELQQLTQVIAARERAGEAAGLDRMRIEVEVANVEDALREAALAQLEAEARAAGLLGVATLPPLEGGLGEAVASADPANMERLRADLAAAELEVQSAERAAAAARRSWIPELTLTGGAQVLELGGPGSELGYVVGLQLPLPIFDRGQREVAIARAQEDLATARKATLLSSARAKLQLAVEAAKVGRDRLERHRKGALVRADELRRAALAAYQGGSAELLVLVEAERVHREAALRFIDLELAASLADANLLFLSGATP